MPYVEENTNIIFFITARNLLACVFGELRVWKLCKMGVALR